jgi:hypothetical protein
VAGLLFFVLWLLARLLWLATSKRKRLLKTGGILFLVGTALGFGATFLPQPAGRPSQRRAPITKAKRVGSLSNRAPAASAHQRRKFPARRRAVATTGPWSSSPDVAVVAIASRKSSVNA